MVAGYPKDGAGPGIVLRGPIAYFFLSLSLHFSAFSAAGNRSLSRRQCGIGMVSRRTGVVRVKWAEAHRLSTWTAQPVVHTAVQSLPAPSVKHHRRLSEESEQGCRTLEHGYLHVICPHRPPASMDPRKRRVPLPRFRSHLPPPTSAHLTRHVHTRLVYFRRLMRIVCFFLCLSSLFQARLFQF